MMQVGRVRQQREEADGVEGKCRDKVQEKGERGKREDEGRQYLVCRFIFFPFSSGGGRKPTIWPSSVVFVLLEPSH